MAVSRSLRFQILRRDNHACQSCGARAPEAKLTVDHVVPTALGGGDEPSNLRTLCEPCNGGKSATPADAAIVAQVAEDAERWSRAQQAVADRMLADHRQRKALHQQFDDAWQEWDETPRPTNWAASVDSFITAGLPMEILIDCIDIAMSNQKIREQDIFRYMCGIAWSRVNKMREQAAAEVRTEEQPEPEGDFWLEGFRIVVGQILSYFPDERVSMYRERAIEALTAEGDLTPEQITEAALFGPTACEAFDDVYSRLNSLVLLVRELMDALPEGIRRRVYADARREIEAGDGDLVNMPWVVMNHLLALARAIDPDTNF